MCQLVKGARVGVWNSSFGQAEITAKSRLGGYRDSFEAHKALAKAGEQGAIVKEKDGSFSAWTVDDGAYLDDLGLGEQAKVTATGKAAGVVDFVGEDGASLAGGQYIEAPIGRDNGKTVYFMRALGNSDKGWQSAVIDPVMSGPNKWLQTDEKALLRAKGYTVVVDNTATVPEIKDALYDQRTAGMVYLGHGGEGGLATYEQDGWLFPGELDKAKVSKNLRMAYFQACQVGTEQDAWQRALGTQTRVYSWDRNATNADVMFANSGANRFSAGSGLANPYLWMGETLSQAIGKMASNN